MGANPYNLVRINSDGYKINSNIIFSTCNIQSLKLKELQVSQLISDYSLDFLVLTETWLKDKHQYWKDTTCLNRNNLKLHTADRKARVGGGLALIHQAQYLCKCTKSGVKPSFEYAIWELKIKNVKLTIHGIYHPVLAY